MKKDETLLFKEEFEWDERISKDKDEYNESFFKGIVYGIGGCAVFAFIMSVIQLF